MSNLSFNAVILTGKISGGSGGEKEIALQRSLEIFYDAGVENVFIAGGDGEGEAFQDHPVLSFPRGAGSGEKILGSAAAMSGTHLLVLDSEFQEMDPNFIIRLIQMSCLGMGVLPFVGDICQPLVACYPVAIRTLSDLVLENDHDAVTLSVEALNRGLVARYQVPSRDALLFDRSDFL